MRLVLGGRLKVSRPQVHGWWLNSGGTPWWQNFPLKREGFKPYARLPSPGQLCQGRRVPTASGSENQRGLYLPFLVWRSLQWKPTCPLVESAHSLAHLWPLASSLEEGQQLRRPSDFQERTDFCGFEGEELEGQESLLSQCGD